MKVFLVDLIIVLTLVLRFYSSVFKAKIKAKGRIGSWVDYYE
jgi:hypothetical protein